MNNDAIELMRYAKTLLRWRRLILGCLFLGTAAGVIVSYSLPVTYRAQCTIMPLDAGRSAAGGALGSMLSAQFGVMGSLMGLGGSSANSQLQALVGSLTLAKYVVEKHDLMRTLFATSPDITLDEAAARLLGMVEIVEGPNQTLIIAGVAASPETAANLATYYVEGLQDFINNNALTRAKRYRIFIEKQLAGYKRDLLEAGKDLNTFYKDSRVSSVESKVDVPIDSMGLKAVTSADFPTAPTRELHAATSTDERTNFWEAYAQLEAKKVAVESQFHATGGDNVVRGVPQQVYLQYLTLRRELLGQLSTMLAREYEMAKMEEAKDELAFQQIDPALPPKSRFKPNRRVIVVGAFVIALLGSVLAAFLLDAWREGRVDAVRT